MNIVLTRQYLFHDIDQWTYRLGNVHVADAVLRNEAQSDMREDSDQTFFIRKITNAVADIKWLMGSRLKKSAADSSDSISANQESWTLSTQHDEQYDTDASALADLIHHYVVAHVIMHWAGIYAPDSVKTTAQELASLAGQIRATLFSLAAPKKHRRPSPAEEITITVTQDESI